MTQLNAIMTDDASNNIKAFKGQPYHWVPCFGHNLHLVVNKTVGLEDCMCMQNLLPLPVQKFIHDEPTCQGPTFDMVDRFCEQQQAICTALAENRNRWHLLPTDADTSRLETVQQVLAPLSTFIDSLSVENDTTLACHPYNVEDNGTFTGH